MVLYYKPKATITLSNMEKGYLPLGLGKLQNFVMSKLILLLSQTSPCFYVCSTSLLKTLLKKEKIAWMSNFSSFCSVFSTPSENFPPFT